MAENVFVITATNKLISQKLSTTRQMMKKKQDTKNSESITEYINVDHLPQGNEGRHQSRLYDKKKTRLPYWRTRR
jgi:hypothetical protein